MSTRIRSTGMGGGVITRRRTGAAAAAAIWLVVASCTASAPETTPHAVERVAGVAVPVLDTAVQGTFDAAGTAQPVRAATLGTKLMGTVLDVLVQEGDAVRAGQPLVRIDAHDIAAKQAQAQAGMAEAAAVRDEALLHARRMRALYADSAAPRAQLDAAETGLARAEAGVRAARGAMDEAQSAMGYAVVRAPFDGTVTRRFVDPGAFAAPGAPLVTVQDDRRLRISATTTPEFAATLRRGQRIDVTIEGRATTATVEGIVPAAAGNLSTVNAIVNNAAGAVLPGSAATLRIPQPARRALLVPARAVLQQGDLTGVTLRTADGDVTRWVRLGQTVGEMVEITGGLRAADTVVVPGVAPSPSPPVRSGA